jgi:hypothetical protein
VREIVFFNLSLSRESLKPHCCDELRERGFSKDGKHSPSQVALGLLVSKERLQRLDFYISKPDFIAMIL